MLGVGLERSGADPVDIAVREAEAADVHVPQVRARFAPDDPFGDKPARAARIGDACGDALGDNFRIGDENVVADQLNFATPASPFVTIEIVNVFAYAPV